MTFAIDANISRIGKAFCPVDNRCSSFSVEVKAMSEAIQSARFHLVVYKQENNFVYNVAKQDRSRCANGFRQHTADVRQPVVIFSTKRFRVETLALFSTEIARWTRTSLKRQQRI